LALVSVSNVEGNKFLRREKRHPTSRGPEPGPITKGCNRGGVEHDHTLERYTIQKRSCRKTNAREVGPFMSTKGPFPPPTHDRFKAIVSQTKSGQNRRFLGKKTTGWKGASKLSKDAKGGRIIRAEKGGDSCLGREYLGKKRDKTKTKVPERSLTGGEIEKWGRKLYF